MARAPRRWAPPAFGAFVLFGWWASGLEPFSTRATLAVLAAGVMAMIVGGARRAVSSPQHTPLRAAAPWFVLIGALMAWQLFAYVQHPRSDHPTLSSLTNTTLDPRPVRALAFAAWMVTGAWLART